MFYLRDDQWEGIQEHFPEEHTPDSCQISKVRDNPEEERSDLSRCPLGTEFPKPSLPQCINLKNYIV